mmetsp:Transcript_7999/g.18690  ORF Transcript_7999/g.18690 Transcript_7999/m.18690 type:complete len:125 (-) Transcript_7999:77-451(-)
MSWPMVPRVQGYTGHKPCWVDGDPVSTGKYEQPEPNWPRVSNPHVMKLGYGGRPGWHPKNWTKDLKFSYSTRVTLIPPADIKGHPAHYANPDGFQRNLHGMPGYAGHKPLSWRPPLEGAEREEA